MSIVAHLETKIMPQIPYKSMPISLTFFNRFVLSNNITGRNDDKTHCHTLIGCQQFPFLEFYFYFSLLLNYENPVNHARGM